MILSWEVAGQSDERLAEPALVRYTASATGGPAFDGDEAELSFQFIQGVCYRRWSVGVGVGTSRVGDLRFYPFFGNLSWDVITRGKTSVYLRCGVGSSNVRLDDWSGELDASTSKDGLIVNPAAGIRFSLGSVHLISTFGYQFMRGAYGVTWSDWGGTNQQTTTVEVRQLYLHIGIGIN